MIARTACATSDGRGGGQCCHFLLFLTGSRQRWTHKNGQNETPCTKYCTEYIELQSGLLPNLPFSGRRRRSSSRSLSNGLLSSPPSTSSLQGIWSVWCQNMWLARALLVRYRTGQAKQQESKTIGSDFGISSECLPAFGDATFVMVESTHKGLRPSTTSIAIGPEARDQGLSLVA